MADPQRSHAPIAAPKISDEALDEFIAIYKKEFKGDISRAEAGQMASDLLVLYALVSRKLPSEQNVPPGPTQHDTPLK